MSLKGVKCNLRSVGSKDIDTILLWENNPEIRKAGCAEKIFIRDDIERFVQNQRYDITLTEQQRFMIDTIDGDTVGAIDLFDYDGHSAGIGILVYPDTYRRMGYATDALRTLTGYARSLRLSSLHASVAADNTASMRLFDTCGFHRTFESDGIVSYRLEL